MNVHDIVRRLAGAARNAIVWSVAWFALAFVTLLAMRTIGVVVPASIGVLDALGMAIRVGIVGGITSGAFSAFMSFAYRGRRLAEISWPRFGLAGAVVAGVFVPAFMIGANLLTGGGLVPFSAIRSDIVIATIFGGVAAGASMWLAQRACRSA